MEKFINFTGDAVDVILQGIQVVAMVDERFGCGGGGGGGVFLSVCVCLFQHGPVPGFSFFPFFCDF